MMFLLKYDDIFIPRLLPYTDELHRDQFEFYSFLTSFILCGCTIRFVFVFVSFPNRMNRMNRVANVIFYCKTRMDRVRYWPWPIVCYCKDV